MNLRTNKSANPGISMKRMKMNNVQKSGLRKSVQNLLTKIMLMDSAYKMIFNYISN